MIVCIPDVHSLHDWALFYTMVLGYWMDKFSKFTTKWIWTNSMFQKLHYWKRCRKWNVIELVSEQKVKKLHSNNFSVIILEWSNQHFILSLLSKNYLKFFEILMQCKTKFMPSQYFPFYEMILTSLIQF